MQRFTNPRDIFHGKGALEALKTLEGKRAIICVGGGSMKRFGFLVKGADETQCSQHLRQPSAKSPKASGSDIEIAAAERKASLPNSRSRRDRPDGLSSFPGPDSAVQQSVRQ